MRAVIYAGSGGPEVIGIGEVPKPEVRPGHIRVRVHAAGLNRADLIQRRGQYAAPHGWLYPRMAAVVHHGGAGTIAAGLHAGVPTVVVPHMADQPFWGQRIHALGVGPRPIPRPRLTAENLGKAIRLAAADPAMRRRAADLGAKIRAEDGVGRAVGLIEAYLRGR